MQLFVILVAVLLSVQAATVPPVVIPKVSVPLPGQVLAPPKDVVVEVPAVVVEVSKDHKHNPDIPVSPLKLTTEGLVAATTVHPIPQGVPEVVATTVHPVPQGVPEVVATTVHPVPQGVPEVVVNTVHPVPQVVLEVVATTVKTVVVEGSGVKVTTAQPIVQHVVRQKRSVEEGVPTEGSGHDMVSTVQPLMVKEGPVVVIETGVTTEQPEEEVTTNPSVEEGTTEVEGVTEGLVVDEGTTVVALIDDVVMSVVNNEAVTIVLPDVTEVIVDGVVTTVQPIVVTEKVTEVSTSVDSEEKSKEQSEDDSSSSEEEERHVPDVLTHPHIKEEGTVPHVTPIPPISEDVDQSSSSSSSSEEDSPKLDQVPQHQTDDVVVVRHRRAMPYSDNSNLATATPKLTTDPKVIADIMAKSKRVQLRNRAERAVVDESVATTKISTTPTPMVMEKSNDNNNDMATGTINPCDLLCTKFEIDPVCASNGLCLYEFPNQCIMDTYNCKHPKQKFSATRDDRCRMNWLAMCQESELV